MVIETVKPAENGSGLAVRLYDSAGAACDVRIRPDSALRFTGAAVCDLLEEHPKAVPFEDGAARVHVNPFEIVTVLFE